RLTRGIKKFIPSMPLWSNQLRPTGNDLKQIRKIKAEGNVAVVYFPTCISRVMGASVDGKKSIIESFRAMSEKAGVNFIVPDALPSMCCGQPFSSKGFTKAFAFMANQTVEQLWQSIGEGRLPV